MIGLYILLTQQLEKDKTIKFGMSMRLEYRWIDYLVIFNDAKYIYYYEILDNLSRQEILEIEYEILCLHQNKRNNFYQTEYFYCDDNNKFHQSIINVLNIRKIKYIVHDIHDFDKNNYDNVNEPLNRTLELEKFMKKTLVPRDYQNEIITTSIEYYQKNNKGMLILICGVGKTLISLWIALKLKSNSILIGVPNSLLLEQWEEIIKGNNKTYAIMPNINILLVNSYCNKNDIIDFLKINKKCVVITTYHSSLKVLKATDELNYEFDMKIPDECHHLTTSNMELASNKKTFIHMLKIKAKKQISLTATLKQIETDTLNPNIISNENKEYFGEIIEKKNMIWGINKNIICDYVILTIITDKLELDEILSKFDIFNDCDKRIFLSAYIALKSIAEKHTHHLLLYCNSTENANKIINYIKLLIKFKYFDINDLFFDSYHSKLDEKTKNNIINNFDTSAFGIIACVYTLGEGWDFPKLDGVVFVEIMSSVIRIVQSALRASRKNINEPNKLAKIMIPVLYNENWLNSDNDDYKKIKEIIYQLSLEDETILTKVKVVKINIKNNLEKNNLENNISQECADTIGEQHKELTDKLKLHIIPRQTLNITYEKARKIIKDKNIKNLNKELYYNICMSDIRLPLNPEEHFKGFFDWIYYLNIDRIYYELDKCKEIINTYIHKYNELKTHYLNLDYVCKKLCCIDNKFPPYGLWVEYYKLKDLSEIIKMSTGSKKQGVLF